MFASWIPEITELAAQRNKYGGKYNKDVRKRYTKERESDVPKMIDWIFSLTLFFFVLNHSNSYHFLTNRLCYFFCKMRERFVLKNATQLEWMWTTRLSLKLLNNKLRRIVWLFIKLQANSRALTSNLSKQNSIDT